jgi:hypothetical protein
MQLFYFSAKSREEVSRSINLRIRNQYKEKLEDLEKNSKITKALNVVCPKVDSLIDSDESNTNLENKLFYSEFHVRKSPGYICTPQLSITNIQPIPEKMQDRIYEEIDNEDTHTITGMIPEIDIAFFVVDNVFHYWSLGSRSQLVQSIELPKQIVSVGLIRPPSGYYTFLKCDHLLFLGSDHNLIPCEISFTNQYNRGCNTHINKLEGKIKCENISHDKIAFTENSRIFVGCKNAKLNELKFETIKSWFSSKVSKTIHSEQVKQSNWLWTMMPTLFSRSQKEMSKIAIDEARHIVYTLSFKEFDEDKDIRP